MARRPPSSPVSDADDDDNYSQRPQPNGNAVKPEPLSQVTNATNYSRLRKGKGKARQIVQDEEDEENEPLTGTQGAPDGDADGQWHCSWALFESVADLDA